MPIRNVTIILLAIVSSLACHATAQRNHYASLVAEGMRRFYMRPRYLMRWARRAYQLPLGNLLRLAVGAPKMLFKRRSG